MKHATYFSAAALVFTAFAPFPAAAQDAPGDRVNQLVIYGDDACPQSTDNEIVVCARKGENERFRIPETLRDNPNAATNDSWAARAQSFEYVGKSGTNSCSPTGAGGFTGCTQDLLRQAYAERAQDDTVNWGKLIEEERQKRLARIDGDADTVEARQREMEGQSAEQAVAAAEARARLEAQDAADAASKELSRPPNMDEAPETGDE